MSDIYQDGTYLTQNPLWHQEDSAWKARHIAQMIRRNGLKPVSVCEVGCGAGEVLRQLSQELGGPTRYHGFEISPQAFDLCRGKAAPGLTFTLGDAFDQPERFDLVLAIDVIEHVEDYRGFLRQLRKCGTYKILHIPLDLSAQAVLRSFPLRHLRTKYGHIHYFTRQTALSALADMGYRVLDCVYTAGALELDHQTWRSRLAELPRRLVFGINQDLAARLLGGFSLLVLAR